MKAILTLICILIFGAIALANTEIDAKVDVIKMDIVLDGSANIFGPTSQIEVNTQNGVARLYKFKNSRVKKALKFITKRNKAKLV